MLKHKGTYEIISPEDIGLERSNEAGIVLGKLRYFSLCSLSKIDLESSDVHLNSHVAKRIAIC